MSNQKKFGVWLDTRQAKVVGNENDTDTGLVLLAQVKAEGSAANSSENAANNHEKTLQAKFFKEISTHIVNATHVHVTGTGQVQEQFIKYLSDTAQFKNTKATESTSNAMSDEHLLEMMAEKF